MRKISFAVLFFTTAAFAETTIGNYPLSVNSGVSNVPLPTTVIDVNSGATSAGNIGAVVVRFNQFECSGNAFKVKFFRGVETPVMIAERGPFPVTGQLTKVQLTPHVAVLEGDLIAVTQLKDCAGLVGQTPVPGFKNAVQYSGDITTAGAGGSPLSHFALAAYGAESMNSEVRTQIILAAGATAGIGGASFKTDLFLANLNATPSKGRIVYHPAGTSGSPADPSFPFTVDIQRTVNLSNFVSTKLGLTGVGSIDVYTTIGFEAPNALVRIYDDAGAAGTKGFTMDAVNPDEALGRYENAVLFAPNDASRFRMNLGIRTIEATDVQFFHLAADGTSHGLTTRSFPANYFIQGAVRDFTGVNPQAGDQIVVYTTQKPFFAYGSIIDNTTNDPSVQIARHLE